MRDRNGSAVKTFAVLEFLGRAGMPLTLSDIAYATGLNKSTARRFLLTLCDLGYVERTPDGRHRITARVLDLSALYRRTVTLPQHAMPYLEQFCAETETSTSLAVLDGTDAVYVAHVAVRPALRAPVHVGTRLPAHATAVGKVLLAYLTPAEVRRRYGNGAALPCYTSQTISDVASLLGALQEIRRQGWAVSEEEYEVGVRAAACPIFGADGRPLCVVNVSTRTDHVSRIDFQTRLVPALLRTAYDISRALEREGT